MVSSMAQGKGRMSKSILVANRECLKTLFTDFLISQRGGGGSSSSSTSSGVHPSPGIRIHDGLPPGPHAEALAAWLPQMYAQINPSGDYSDPSSPTGFPIPDASAIGEVLRQTGRMVSSSSLLRGGRSGARGRGGAATRGRGASIYRSGISADYRRELEKLIPPKHDPRFVLNHNKRQPDGSSKAESTRKGFSFGIVEPPLDVETFDQDPRIIRGPLPDTSPICAGCDCALVLDGSHQRRIWALPCGHVIDGRCYTRYCHGVTPARARELAREEVKQSSSINAQSRQQPSAGSDPNKDELTQSRQVKITEHFAPGTKRSLQESADSQTEDEEADADISKGSTRSAVKDEDFSSWPTASLPASRDPDQPPPSKRTRVSSKDLQGNPANQASATHATLTATAPLSTDGRSAAAGRDAETGAAESRVVKTFVCPVEGCSQRCNTTPHKAASAIELYV